MTEMERLVWEAWARVGPKVLGDEGELRRRLARRARVLKRWPREVCVGVRAGDTRLGGLVGVTVEGEAVWEDVPGVVGGREGGGEGMTWEVRAEERRRREGVERDREWERRVGAREARGGVVEGGPTDGHPWAFHHEESAGGGVSEGGGGGGGVVEVRRERIRLTGGVVREMARGVSLRGASMPEAARRLGVSVGVLAEWVRAGRGEGRVRVVDGRGEVGVLPHQVELLGKLAAMGEVEPDGEVGRRVARGRRKVVVEALGTFWLGAAVIGSRGDPAWWAGKGGLGERVPEGWSEVVERERVARWGVRYGKRVKVWGVWKWVCPGCGGRVKRMYLPVGVWSLAEFLGVVGRAERGEGEGGLKLRCEGCARVVKKTSWGAGEGWDLAVAHFSGGLLYGREVERPGGREGARGAWKDAARGSRRGVFRARVREEVLGRLARGETCAAVAAALGMRVRNVWLHVQRARKAGVEVRLGRRRVKTEGVRRLMEGGMGYAEVAAELGMSLASVYTTACKLRKEGRLEKGAARASTCG